MWKHITRLDVDMSYRKITSAERALIERMLSFRSDENDEGSIQVEDHVKVIDKEGSLKFAHESQPKRMQQEKFPVEAQLQDLDGIWIHALLFVVDNKVDELEIYKDDSSEIVRRPRAEEWEIFKLPFA